MKKLLALLLVLVMLAATCLPAFAEGTCDLRLCVPFPL